MIEQVGRYKILEKIGEGAAAELFKAYDPSIDRTLAFKILRKERCLDEEYVNRFLREAKAAGVVTHPNIVTVYDVGRVEDRPYIIMELVDGTPLDQILKEDEKPSLKQAITIGIQLAKALNYAHETGIVHRDIKPSNVLMLRDGDTVKITDFGIAHIDETDATQHTQMGAVLGTPLYMSPEQVAGGKVDGRSDLYSVGVVLYQLLTGQRPYSGNTMATLLYQITKEEPPPIEEAAPDVPVGLRHIVSKLLSKQPEKRFQTGAELAKALTRELRSLEELEAETDRPGYIPIRLKWTLMMAGMVAVTMAVSIFLIYQKQSQVLTRYAIDSGASLARFIASESAELVLIQDWVAIELFVNDASKQDTFTYLYVLDHENTVRGATDASMVGKPFSGIEEGELLAETEGLRTTMVRLPNGARALDFDTAITYQDTSIGRLRLGLSQTAAQGVIDTTLMLLIALALVTISAVAIIFYVIAKFLSRPLRTLRLSMGEVATGNLDCRISEQRNDELGDLFGAFNKMAAALEHAESEKRDPSKDA